MSPPPGSLPWLSQRLDWTYLLFHAPSEGSVWEQRLWAKDTQLTCWSLTPPQSTVTQWDPLVPRGQGRSQPKMPERLCPGRVAHSPGDLGVQAKPHCQLAVCLGEFTMPLWSSITSSEKWVWLTLVLLSLLGGLIFSIRTRAPQCDKSGLIFRSNGRETVNAESLTYMIHIHRGPGAGDVFLTHPPWGGRLQVWGVWGRGRVESPDQSVQGHLLGLHAHSPSEEVWRDPGAGWCRPPLTSPHTQERAPGFTHPSCHYDGNQGSFPTPSYKGSLQKGKQPA